MERQKISVVCSGANEHTDISEMVELSLKYPLEYGIQVSGKKCSFGTPRWFWINELHNYLLCEELVIDLALHLNQDWVEGFTSGEVPPELDKLLKMTDVDGNPLFKRVQLNFKIGRENRPVRKVIEQRIEEYGQGRRFIFSYNPENKSFIHRLYKFGLRDFDDLYDSSHGEGIKGSEYLSPAFYDEGIFQGYAGGLSPDNVAEEVGKILKVVPRNRAFFIDAEGKLKGKDGHLSLKKCERFVFKALSFTEEKN